MKVVTVVVGLLLLVGVAACGGDDDDNAVGNDVREQGGNDARVPETGAPCTSAENCAGGLVCVPNENNEPVCSTCSGNGDDMVCKVQLGADYVCTNGACVEEQPVTCEPACEEGFACDPETQQCLEACNNSQDCDTVGQLCLNDVCNGDCNDYMTSDPDAADTKCDFDFRSLTDSDWICGAEGICVPKDGSPVCGDGKLEGDEGCEEDADCGAGQLCMDCACAEDLNECHKDFDCTPGLICEVGNDGYNHCEQCMGTPRCQEQYGPDSECTGNFVDLGECTFTCGDGDACSSHDQCEAYCNLSSCTCDN